MTSKKFTSSAAIRFGWENFKKNPWYFIEILLLWIGVELMLSQVGKIVQQEGMLASLVFSLIAWVIKAGFLIGVYTIILKVISGKQPLFGDLFTKFRLATLIKFSLMMSIFIFPIILVSLIPAFNNQSSLLFFVVFPLLVIFETVLIIRFGFSGFLLVDKKEMGPIEALKESWRMTKGHWNALVIFTICLFSLNSIGLLLFMAGLLITLPISFIASGYVYRKFTS